LKSEQEKADIIGDIMIQDNDIRKLYLEEELLMSKDILVVGMKELQSISPSNDQYYVPLQLISMAFERLMKCYLCLGYYEQNNRFCSYQELKKYGHNLLNLKEAILRDYFNSHKIPALEEDKRFLEENDDLREMLSILSDFGEYLRYYNLDVVTGVDKSDIDVKRRWDTFEDKLIDRDSFMREHFLRNCYDNKISSFVNKEIIILIESFVRALSRQFTIGRLSNLAKQLSVHYKGFYNLMDNELGTRNYTSFKA